LGQCAPTSSPALREAQQHLAYQGEGGPACLGALVAHQSLLVGLPSASEAASYQGAQGVPPCQEGREVLSTLVGLLLLPSCRVGLEVLQSLRGHLAQGDHWQDLGGLQHNVRTHNVQCN
jgi:hypothetical protein